MKIKHILKPSPSKSLNFFSFSASRFSSLITENKKWNIWVAIFGHILKGEGVGGYWSNPSYQNLWKAGAKNGDMQINIWNLFLSLICSLFPNGDNIQLTPLLMSLHPNIQDEWSHPNVLKTYDTCQEKNPDSRHHSNKTKHPKRQRITHF